MTRTHASAAAVMFVLLVRSASAQPPVRAGETTRTVTLSLAEYNRLIDLAARPPQNAPPAPVASVLSNADLRVRVDRDSARGTFTLTGEVLRPGISRVNLIAGATLIEASLSGRPVPLAVDGSAPGALLPGPGPFSLALEWGAPLAYAPGRASFVLPVPKSGTARATVDLPGDQADVHLSTGLITRRSVAAGRTIIEATLDPGANAQVWWSMRDSAPVAAAREVRMLADVMTLVTLGDADVRMVALLDVTVVQGEPRIVEAHLPPGYEVTGISGSSLESSDARDGVVVLRVGDSTARRHQFLLTLERPHETGSFKLETGLLAVPDAQRERGEIAVEGVGTLELTAAERDGMHRLDVRELNSALRSLTRLPILSAFRYQRSTASPAGLSLDVTRFADSGVLAAVADRATATTLVTSEGRALTEVALTVQNRAQPFLKVTLPAGASIVSVDVAGESAKPVLGTDGARVPLLRPGFRPTGPYAVTFVYLQTGAPFAKKGEMQMALPKMDVPVGIVHWELFVPDTYTVRAFDGNAIAQPAAARAEGASADGVDSRPHAGSVAGGRGGESVSTASVAETVTVTGESPKLDRSNPANEQKATAPSQNVIDLQRRTAGVLPVRIDVPRAGTSHRFVKPLVVDQEATVSFRYKRR